MDTMYQLKKIYEKHGQPDEASLYISLAFNPHNLRRTVERIVGREVTMSEAIRGVEGSDECTYVIERMQTEGDAE
jgi:hypothetical protein